MRNFLRLSITITFLLNVGTSPVTAGVNSKEIGEHYVYLAYSMFSDTLAAAQKLDESIQDFIDKPNIQTHEVAKQQWITAHTLYSQTEVFRFGNPNVDEWEGKVNAWPMDEGLLDYVHPSYTFDDGNPHANENLIAGDALINHQLVESMHEVAGSEANVSSGYHSIEFLLWGQDLNKEKQSSGNRPYTDYVQGDGCTNQYCARRSQYLKAVTEVLISDLEQMVEQWHPQKGSYTKEFYGLPVHQQLNRILLGLGGLGFGELAAERIRVALIANAQEDEQSCFSDTTDLAILNNTIAIRNVYHGRYTTIAGVTIQGPSLQDLVESQNAQLNQTLIKQFKASIETASLVSSLAREGDHFDQQILADNYQGNERLGKLIEQLRLQTQTIESITQLITNNS